MSGSVRANGKRWLGRYHVAGNAYFTATRERKGQVPVDLAAIRGEVLAGTWTPPKPRKRGVKSPRIISGRATVEEYGRAWLVDLERADASPNTLRTYRSNLNAHIVPAIGGLLLDEVGTADIAGVVIPKVPPLPPMEVQSELSKRRALTASELRAVKRDPSGRPVLGPPKSRAGYRVVSIPPQARWFRGVLDAASRDKPGLLFPCITGLTTGVTEPLEPGWRRGWGDVARSTPTIIAAQDVIMHSREV